MKPHAQALSPFSLLCPLTINEPGACESGDTWGQCQEEGLGECFLRFPGHAQCLPVSLPLIPGFSLPGVPPPSPITFEILSALSRLSLDAILCPTKPHEPSHSYPHNKNLSFPLLHSLSTLSVLLWGQVLLSLHFILGCGLSLLLDS